MTVATSARVLRDAGPTLSVPEAASCLGISRGFAYELIARGDWPTKVLQLGHRYRIPTAALRRVLDEQEAPSP